MSIQATPEELRLRRELGAIFKAQKDEGWSDWGELTAHCVLCYREEIDRLRHFIREAGLDPGDWSDPWECLEGH